MAIPSFDELLSQARNIARSQESERTGNLMAKGLSEGFTNAFLKPSDETRQHEGYLTQEGEIVQQPYSTDRSLVETFFNKLFGRTPFQPPEGAVGMTGKEMAEFQTKRILQGEKPQISLEKTLGETLPDLSEAQLKNIFGEGAARRMTFRQLQASKQPQARNKEYLSTKPAMDIGFMTEREANNLFPDVPENERKLIPVSEVQSRRFRENQKIAVSLDKPLTKEQSQLIVNAKEGVEAVNRILPLLERRPDIFRKGSFKWETLNDIASTGDLEAQQFLRDRRVVSDIITRMRTGAALNDYELEFYPTLISTLFSSEEIVPENLGILKNFFEGLEYEIKSGKRNLSGVSKGRSPLQGKKKSAEDILKEFKIE